ncbi:hypothetical protein [Hyphococcus sp.]|uniref:hypothetical protein n=1 Tax=Hyphococcus sp. TaxID=2038636 RepID=UPI003CCBE664
MSAAPEKNDRNIVPDQDPETQDLEDTCENEHNYGGRDNTPDADVNEAERIHIDDDEEGAPARTEDHAARRRKDRPAPGGDGKA